MLTGTHSFYNETETIGEKYRKILCELLLFLDLEIFSCAKDILAKLLKNSPPL